MYAAAEIADRVRPYTHQHHHQLASSFSLGLDDHRHLRSLVVSVPPCAEGAPAGPASRQHQRGHEAAHARPPHLCPCRLGSYRCMHRSS